MNNRKSSSVAKSEYHNGFLETLGRFLFRLERDLNDEDGLSLLAFFK